VATTEKRQYIQLPAGLADLPFSSAVAVGNTLYLAGHIGLEPGAQKPSGDPEREARDVLDSVRDTLTRAGYTLQDVASLTIFCPDLSLYETFNNIYRAYFRPPFPARAFIGSGPLLLGARFEIQAIAVKGAD
jgi:2-iminobutanoate/2-iminopropanoate deaminase